MKILANKSQEKKIREIIRKVPVKILDRITSIKVEDIPYNGLYDNSTKEIKLNPDLFSNYDFLKYVLYHEIGHSFDYQVGLISSKISMSPQIFYRGEDQKNHKEYFAELFSLVLLNDEIKDVIIYPKKPMNFDIALPNGFIGRNPFKLKMNYIKEIISEVSCN